MKIDDMKNVLSHWQKKRNALLHRAVKVSVFVSFLAASIFPTIEQAHSEDLIKRFLMFNKRSAEWNDRFDATARGDVPVFSREPMLSAQTAANIERAMLNYQRIVENGGWPAVPTNVRLRLGLRHKNVEALRQRLIASGDLRQSGGRLQIYDSFVKQAVRRFQQRHGIIADGVVRKDTFAALNVPAIERLGQLQTNLVRVRSMSGFLGERYVMVNIPAASLEAVEDGLVISRHTAIVGKIDRQTPILASRIHELNFNPFWTVPKSIIRKDLIPKMKRDPQYLTRNKIRIYDQRGNELLPEQVNWNSDEAVKFMFRQDPGEINSLGSVKINFHNPHSVYLHDTPGKSLFGKDYRFLSSGCVRVQNIRELITWLLQDNSEWNRTRIDLVNQMSERIDVRLKKPVPLYLNYVTAWANANGVVNFRQDIYQRDGLSMVTAQN